MIIFDYDRVVHFFGQRFGNALHPIWERLGKTTIRIVLPPVILARLSPVELCFWSSFEDTVAVGIQMDFTPFHAQGMTVADEVLV